MDTTSESLVTLLYGRVSDRLQQGDNWSIPAQLAKMREKCIELDWPVYAELEEKESAFVNGLERSELNKAVELARQGKIQALMFFSPDRFTRDIGDGVILRRYLSRYRVRIYCYWPHFHEITSEMEVLNILTDWQSQQQIERQRDLSLQAVRKKATDGVFSQGSAPYGYRLEGKKRETQVVICEEEAYIVRRIYHWYCIEGIGCSEIAHRLNDEGVPSPEQNKKRGVWVSTRINKILSNETYAGIWYAFRFQMIGKRAKMRPRSEWLPVPITPIISRTLYETAKTKRQTRHAGRAPKHNYLMSGRMTCRCGISIEGQGERHPYVPKKADPATYKQREYYYYRCGSHDSISGSCGLRKFHSDQVDATVWEFALELLHNPRKLLQGLRDMQASKRLEYDSISQQISAITTQITELSGKLQGIIDQISTTNSKAVITMLEKRREEVGGAIDGLQTRLEKLQEQSHSDIFSEEQIEAAITEIGRLAQMYAALDTINEEADFSAKRALIEILNLRAIPYIKENGERWVDIYWFRETHSRRVGVVDLNPSGLNAHYTPKDLARVFGELRAAVGERLRTED